MSAEDGPVSGETLPMPINYGEAGSSFAASNIETPPASPESTRRQPIASSGASDSGVTSTPPVPAPAQDTTQNDSQPVQDPKLINNKQYREEVKRRYSEETKRAIDLYSADPFIEVQKIESIRRNYQREVYGRKIKALGVE